MIVGGDLYVGSYWVVGWKILCLLVDCDVVVLFGELFLDGFGVWFVLGWWWGGWVDVGELLVVGVVVWVVVGVGVGVE